MSADMDKQLPRSRKRRRHIIAGTVVVSVLFLSCLGVSLLLKSAHRSVSIPIATTTIDTVQAGVFHDQTVVRGKIVPHDIVYLDALEGGQVARVLAHAGDQVNAGQPLLAFRNTELELDVLDREGRLIESMTELQTFEKQLEDTRLSNAKAAEQIAYNIVRLGRASMRRRGLASAGDIPAESDDQIHDELTYNVKLQPLQLASNQVEDTLRSRQLPQIRAELTSLKESLKITRGKLENLLVSAPVSGKLTDLIENIGENRNRGDRLGEIVPDTGFKVTAAIDEYYLGRVRTGQPATVNLDGRAVLLKVTRVYPEVKDNVFTVDLAFDAAPPANLSPGEAVYGSLSLGGDRTALVLPAGSFLERTGGDWAMVLDQSGRHADRRGIKIGRRSTDQVEVLSGLRPGDRVITSDYAAFEKVDRVNLTR